MQKILWQLAAFATLAASIAAQQAKASVVVDFNDPSLETAYAPGDSFTQSGFLMTQLDDAGLVGSNYDLGSIAPVGNSSLYYSNFNNGSLLVQRVDGAVFSLQSFDLAFLPLVSGAALPPTLYLGVLSLDSSGAVDFPFIFDYAAATPSGNPFLTYGSSAFPGAYQNVSALQFFSCSLNATQDGCIDARNNGQFALDNLTFSAPVPEPTTSALLVLGVVALIGQKRLRSNSNDSNDRSRRISG